MSAAIVDQLRSKVHFATAFAMERSGLIDNPQSPWWNYYLGEALRGELTEDTTIVYTRENHPNAKIRLTNIQLSDLSTFNWGNAVTIKSNNPERYLDDIRVDDGATYDTTVSHTFAKTTSLEEAAKVGLELSFEASIGYKAGNAGGVEGGVKFGAKATAEYNRKWGSSQTQTDTVSRHVFIKGPWDGKYEAVRSVDKVSMTITTKPTFEFQIEIMDGDTTLYKWNSFEELTLVLEGNAPTNRDLAKEVLINPVSTTELRSINHYILPDISFTAVYDDVNYQRINIVKDKEGTDRVK